MSTVRSRTFVGPVLWLVATVSVVAILRPWTVRPLEDRKLAAFDAASFVVSAWPRVLREARQTATDVSELAIQRGSSSAIARFLKGTGVVAGVDRQSRVGILLVDVAGSQPVMAAIQIGPVIRGTALRDASSFIQFSDFNNQFDFAGAANALNNHVLRTVIGAVPVDTLARPHHHVHCGHREVTAPRGWRD